MYEVKFSLFAAVFHAASICSKAPFNSSSDTWTVNFHPYSDEISSGDVLSGVQVVFQDIYIENTLLLTKKDN